MPGKSTGNQMRKGEIVIALTPGAGGYGDPYQRIPEKVLEDVMENYVTVDKARELYGVVIEEDERGFFHINEEETRAVRSRQRVDA